jgi:hypothetical protein
VHKGEGTGVFAGQKIILQASVVDDPADLPCTPLGPTVKLEGIIID